MLVLGFLQKFLGVLRIAGLFAAEISVLRSFRYFLCEKIEFVNFAQQINRKIIPMYILHKKYPKIIENFVNNRS